MTMREISEKTPIRVTIMLGCALIGTVIGASVGATTRAYEVRDQLRAELDQKVGAAADRIRSEQEREQRRFVTREELYKELGDRFERLENRLVLQLRGR